MTTIRIVYRCAVCGDETGPSWSMCHGYKRDRVEIVIATRGGSETPHGFEEIGEYGNYEHGRTD